MWRQHIQGLEIGLHTGRTPFQEERASLLCLHGAGGEGLLFRPQLSVLSRQVNVAAIDLPAHGSTPGPAFERIAQCADWVAHVIQRGPIRPVVLGHSMGGAVALSLALRHPELLSGLVLSSTGARLPVSAALMQEFSQDFPKAVSHMLHLAYAPGTPEVLLAQAKEQMLKVSPQVMLSDLTACDRFDVSGAIGGIDLPALVVVGNADRMTPPQFSSFLSQEIKGARLEIIQGAGHILNLEKPAPYNQIVADFMLTLSTV